MLKTANLIAFLATTNSERAKEFYEQVLGLEFRSEDGFALVFESNGIMLRIQKVEHFDPPRYTSLGWSVDDIKKEVKLLTRRGVKFSRYEGMQQDEMGIWTSPSGAKIAWFNDPNGNVLSLTQFQ